MTKGESAVITDDEEDLGGDNGDLGNTTPSDDGNKKNETTETKAKETTAATETEAAEGKGCGGVIGGVGVALVSALAAGVAVKSKKRKKTDCVTSI